jgi:hypothetical protein
VRSYPKRPVREVPIGHVREGLQVQRSGRAHEYIVPQRANRPPRSKRAARHSEPKLFSEVPHAQWPTDSVW